MKNYRPIKFNDFLKKGNTYSQDDNGFWVTVFFQNSTIILDMALENGYLELVAEDSVDNPIKIGDKVVAIETNVPNYFYFIVSAIDGDGYIHHSDDCYRPDEIRHCTPDEIAKYFR